MKMLIAVLAGLAALPLQAARAPDPAKVAADAARAARAAGEIPLQEILDKLGYSTDVSAGEVDAQLFVRASDAPVTTRPIAAYGLEKILTAGWYHPTDAKPDKITLWQVGEKNNKQLSPPIVEGGKTSFDPGTKPFGLWVSTAGFKDETVCTEDALQRYVPRFKSDLHKAHVFFAKKDGKVVPNTYIIGWEYSTNNDDQDIVTIVENVKPAGKA